MSVADRFVTDYMPTWLRRHKAPQVASVANSPVKKKAARRPTPVARPTVAFKPRPLNPEQYSTHL